MASPPYNHNYGNAISPPYPSNAQLPQPKRRVSDMPTSAPSLKRRKTSMLSATSAASALHPLRQTSFPPENAPAYMRSPSVDTMSFVSGSAAGGPTKKKRASAKRKGAQNDDATSTAGGGAPTTISGSSGKGKGKRGPLDVDVEEEDEGDDENAVTGAATEAEKEKERENRSLLIRELDPQQFERYEAWRFSKLPDSTVRRLINQTLSQSVPVNVILAVRAVTKLFAGDLIEGARKVQSQWIEAGEIQVGALPSPPAETDQPPENETRKGPLRPDHLRESLRRYKVGREGGSIGQLGVWQQQQSSGVERFGIKTRGRRLLK